MYMHMLCICYMLCMYVVHVLRRNNSYPSRESVSRGRIGGAACAVEHQAALVTHARRRPEPARSVAPGGRAVRTAVRRFELVMQVGEQHNLKACDATLEVGRVLNRVEPVVTCVCTTACTGVRS